VLVAVDGDRDILKIRAVALWRLGRTEECLHTFENLWQKSQTEDVLRAELRGLASELGIPNDFELRPR
jgi:hypothetical protein